MTDTLTPAVPTLDSTSSAPWWTRRRLERAERSRLESHDRVAVRLAELHRMRSLLEDTVVMVNVGWIQQAWFAVRSEGGRTELLSGHDIHRAEDRDVTGVCLVGGIVQSGGGPAAARTQLVQRTLDLTWHALHDDVRRPVRWCPPPDVRVAHVRDLTQWNDAPQRTSRQVSGLLEGAIALVDVQVDRQRAVVPA